MAGMFGSTVLDVAIGLVFVYLLLAILCTSANEILSAITKSRGNLLREGISQLLGNQPTTSAKDKPDALLDQFYRHSLVRGMFRGNRHPAYLPSRTFATVLIDSVLANGGDGVTTRDVEGAFRSLPPGDVRQALLAVLKHIDDDVENAHLAIQGWFEDAMDRVTGWYKRKTQIWTILVALVITLTSNADTVNITRRLWQDPVLR